MHNASFRLFLLAAFFFSPVVSSAADRCMQIDDQLKAELDATQNRLARERAAIADLERPYDRLRKKLQDQEITSEEYSAESSKWSQAETCIKAENGLKNAQAYYTHESKLIEAKCQKGPMSGNAWGVRDEEKRREKACGRADLQTVASMMKRLTEIMAEKSAKEEPETPPVKQVDASLKQSEFCRGIRTASAQAPTFFKSITGEKKDITEEGFGFQGTKIRDLLQTDIYKTPIILALDFLSSNASCDIRIGFNPVLVQRVPPTYGCTWDYEKIARKDLEQKADRLFNVVRGCFAEVSETPVQVHRHSFVGEKSVLVEGDAYFGEGKPSNISIYIRKYTPEADLACAMFLSSKKEADKQVCMQKHIR